MPRHKGTLPITTERLTLRRFCADDAPEIYEGFAGDREVTDRLNWRPVESLERLFEKLLEWEAFYEKKDYYRWAVVFENRVIGTVNAVAAAGWWELGYALESGFWGRGIASEAVSAVLKYLSEEVGIRRFAGLVDEENEASAKMLEKMGFKEHMRCWYVDAQCRNRRCITYRLKM